MALYGIEVNKCFRPISKIVDVRNVTVAAGGSTSFVITTGIDTDNIIFPVVTISQTSAGSSLFELSTYVQLNVDNTITVGIKNDGSTSYSVSVNTAVIYAYE